MGNSNPDHSVGNGALETILQSALHAVNSKVKHKDEDDTALLLELLRSTVRVT